MDPDYENMIDRVKSLASDMRIESCEIIRRDPHKSARLRAWASRLEATALNFTLEVNVEE